METLERPLRGHPFLRSLTDPQIRFMLGCTRNVHFAQGAFVFRENEAADALYVLRTGRIVLETHVPGQGATQLETLQTGDVLGWSWLFEPYRWQLDALAVEPVTAFRVDAQCLRAKMEEDPVFGYALAKPLLRHMHQRLERVRMQRLDIYRTDASRG